MSRKHYQHLNDEALLEFYHSTRNLGAFQHLYSRYKDSLYRYCAQMNFNYASRVLEELWTSLLEHPPALQGRLLRSWLFIRLNRLLRRHPEETLETSPATSRAGPPGAPLLEAIQQLPRRLRNIVLLHMECQLPLATIADIEGISLKQCRDHYHDGKEQLREILHGPRRQPWRIAEVTV
ncbi:MULTISPECIES: RNA polymerase sigma factor [Microbulbifer]|uniref:RNA polymerase sigma factor n=1 Tax=Microbulbifer TaxID=48073 RepID=UPI001E3DDB40|nr:MULTISPECIES: sigma-70 family RNA polymerase sigma factor [Microbulbifer]UHQ56126.1 sigma-70 family RNA polymerase sigma factor [Microbulbifer sp. YPW16]